MPRKILIVDDSKMIRQQVAFTLEKGGYIVIEAVDGLHGVETLRKHSDCSLVIADINMPNMCGLEMIEKIGQNETTNHIPVVMLTTSNQREAMKRAREAGAKGWIPKPFDPRKLLETADKIASPDTQDI